MRLFGLRANDRQRDRARERTRGDDATTCRDECRAFLVGIGNTIAAESACAKRHETSVPPMSARIVAAVS
jgi:hypothetical protein